IPGPAGPSPAEPSRAEPSRAEPSRAEPSRAEPSPAAEPADDGFGAGGESTDRLPPRRRFGAVHLAVIAGVGVLGLVVAGWAVFRARPVDLATPVAASPQVATAEPATPATPDPTAVGPSPAPPTTIIVHVLGAVHRPGLITLPAGARVAEAIERAGGLTGQAAPSRLNLAQRLADGQQIFIGTRREPAGEVSGGDAGSSGGPDPPGQAGGQVDLNAATRAQLEQLPGVGPVTAGRIVEGRGQARGLTRGRGVHGVDGDGAR